ncbi:MAG: hypothetical protein E5X38_07370 [Mesorhizobium sp.]|uniref:hypothetical protein n=1 Tax=unclassified Mesorhizobium TaxID=325217 RepID=UPI000FC9BA92|nr:MULTISPECIES: hypothetical protein [unclassified Mesorhizobium]RUV13250.1 hypothetical protein EOA91_26515 [Mesorhizobium sp. M1A.F.Ca.IN.022.04.1.1]RUV63490.1 hypothetical protein EOA64_08755 [Mesorhizobium sp. M1A.F.Ca.IN.022.02.1.1]RWG36224.1 MAG: hypothetical protein EOQ60_05160 [Mesorhizobium sp.]RWH27021.1 MAG: hypothetical protein EOQ75_03805 [Mesorhizobium sp.]TIM36079.1 MAG: hypothetical protein E5Y45_00015 [Mesorhizobium sp.]
MRDITNGLDLKRAISPQAARTDNTAIVSSVADLKGYDGCMLAINIGANTDANATFAVLIEDSDDNSSFAAVDDAYLNGTEALAGFQFDDDNELRKIGYVGIKRYLRATITPSGNDSGNIFVTAEWILQPLRAPAANPPA